MLRTTCGIFGLIVVLTGLSVGAYAQVPSDYLISWDPNPETNIAYYIVYRSTQPGSGFAAVDSVDGSTFSYIDTGLEKGIRYYYRIVAKNTVGLRSDFSNLVSVMTIPDDALPALRDSCQITDVVNSGYYAVDVNWESAVLSSGFIQYSTDAVLDSASYWDTGDYATTHTATLSDLSPGDYNARAVAIDGSNGVTISAQETFTVDSENPGPLSSPQIFLYPVPYHWTHRRE